VNDSFSGIWQQMSSRLWRQLHVLRLERFASWLCIRHRIVVLQPVFRHRLLLGCLEGRTVVPLRPQFARTGSCVIRRFRPLLFFLCRKRYRDEWVGCSVGALQVRLIQTERSTCSSRVCRVVGSASVDQQYYTSHRGSCQRLISQTLVGRETTNERT
jgi:hypothetical protein